MVCVMAVRSEWIFNARMNDIETPYENHSINKIYFMSLYKSNQK